MKKLALLLFILSAAALQAQTITKEKIIGKWKLQELKADKLTIDLSNPQAMKEKMYQELKDEEPDKIFTAVDSARIDSGIMLMTSIVVEFIFKPNGRFSGTVDIAALGQNKLAMAEILRNTPLNFSGSYKLKQNILTMSENSSGKSEMEISMPDENTLTLLSLRKGGVKLTFARA